MSIGNAITAGGLVSLRGSGGLQDTTNRLDVEVNELEMTVSACAAGLPLPPTELLIFASAGGGPPPMQSIQTIGIALLLQATTAAMAAAPDAAAEAAAASA
jgi:hypothetical protein